MYKTYLGDSVYAEFMDGGMIKLTTENGYPSDPSNEIFLEPEVFLALIGYSWECKKFLGIKKELKKNE